MSKEALESATESGDIFALQPSYESQGLSYYHKAYFMKRRNIFSKDCPIIIKLLYLAGAQLLTDVWVYPC